MHDPSNNHSIMSNSPNRLLNLNSNKFRQTSQQQNSAKKLKVSHTNGIRSTMIQENNATTIRNSKSETSLRCPLRQTLPIFKQPVTYYPKQRDEVKPQVTNTNNPGVTTTSTTGGGKPSEKTKPRQLFWEKRFQNLRPTDIDGQPYETFKLPTPIQGVGLNMSPETTMISLATSLHLYGNSRALFGQNNHFQKYPTSYIQRDQPLIEHVTITDEHIRAQEEKVHDLRRRLQQVMHSNNSSANVKCEV